MKTALLIAVFGLLLFVTHQPVSAQVVCSSSADGFGPTCAATIVPPTNTPIPQATLPPTSTPIPELPKSGNGAITAAAIFGGGVIFLLGLGSLALNKNRG